MSITLEQKIKSTYSTVSKRVKGHGGHERHKRIYTGLAILPKEDFYKWAKNSPRLKKLYKAWVESGFEYKLQPSLDRIDTTKGYTLDNIRWLTFSENSRRSSATKNRTKLATAINSIKKSFDNLLSLV